MLVVVAVEATVYVVLVTGTTVVAKNVAWYKSGFCAELGSNDSQSFNFARVSAKYK